MHIIFTQLTDGLLTGHLHTTLFMCNKKEFFLQNTIDREKVNIKFHMKAVSACLV